MAEQDAARADVDDDVAIAEDLVIDGFARSQLYIKGVGRPIMVEVGMGQWGQELYMRLARAAVARENEQTAKSGSDRFAQQIERIAAAEKILAMPPAGERAAQIAHIAGLKAALKLGPAGLNAKAETAARMRRARLKSQR